MIPIDLYPKHDWDVQYYVGFQTLLCKKCEYHITDRYDDESGNTIKYIRDNFGNMYLENLNEVRKTLLTCDEVIIKDILE